MTPISVVIITFNEEKNLDRCLRSIVDVADEIIVVDSASTDNTVSIAHNFGATVIYKHFMGYGEQKNFAVAQAKNEWVLSLDADEEVSPELMQCLVDIKNKKPIFSYYRIPRLTNYCGKWIRRSGWYPDRQARLFERSKGTWVEKKVHEYWRPYNNETAGELKGDLLHHSFSSISAHLEKINKYSDLAAMAAVEKQKRVTLFKIWGSPKWHFLTEYFAKLGFLDGFHGYVICKLSAYAAFVKYTKIRMHYVQQGGK